MLLSAKLSYGLHQEGVVSIDRPQWVVLDFVESMHNKHNACILRILEKLRPRWSEGACADSLHGGQRLGAKVAELATDELRAMGLGIFISAVHESISDDTWEPSGPRWYASVIDEARKSGVGCCTNSIAPRPPDQVSELLWPRHGDSARPWITELGWTIVPAGSDPQALHADICAAYDEDGDIGPLDRRDDTGRFHHIAWKPKGLGRCTTEIVKRGFTDGTIDDAHYDKLTQAKARCIIIDSEVLHRGAATAANGTAFSSTCTAQLCSTEGWPALHFHGRADGQLMEYTIPIEEIGHLDRGGDGSSRQSSRQSSKRIKYSHPVRAEPGRVAGVSAGIETPCPKRVHDRLRLPGWFELSDGLPCDWRAWPVFGFVEQCHREYADMISMELAGELAKQRQYCKEQQQEDRPGELAAERVNRTLARKGLAIKVYVPPPCIRQEPPYDITGPRFYVSVTQAAKRALADGSGVLPALPRSLLTSLWPGSGDQLGCARVRGLGWALAPPGCDPQQLHADIWSDCKVYRDRQHVRFPHLLWKREAGAVCTTEIAPSGFTYGQVIDFCYDLLCPATARAIVVNSEVLHRGAATNGVQGLERAAVSHEGWVSTCSIELCSPQGWRAWQAGTGGTQANPGDPEWEMLKIAVKPAL